jgi:single-stranded-DNA-specific exonuclease
MQNYSQIKQRVYDDKITGLHASPLLNRIYAARGINKSQQLDLALAHMLEPAGLSNIEQAADLLLAAINQDKRIVVVGDFDCDGATGTAVAVRGLQMLGAKRVFFKVPHRVLHGYGLTPGLVEELHELQPDLIITVDSGIACNPGVTLAKKYGWQVLITDHHLPGEILPPADVILNPNLNDDIFASKALAGVGVMFYLLLAVRKKLREQNLPGADADLSSLLDLVAIGTVADMVKLDANNRRLIRAGLSRINKGRCQPGVRALIEISGLQIGEITETDIGFRIGPKINAAGRLEDMALGIECLLANDKQAATQMALSLAAINADRQELQQIMLDEAEKILGQLITPNDVAKQNAYVLHQAHWHPGVIGLIASKLKETWNRPVAVFAPSEEGSDELRGSARSISGFHMRDALAYIDAQHPGLISRFGGHAMAAGLSLPVTHLQAFEQAFQNVAALWLSPDALDAVHLTDGSLLAHEFNRDNAELIKQGGPWGQGFAEPLFDNEFHVQSWQVLKDKHLKLRLIPASDSAELSISAIYFNAWQGQPPPDKIRAVYHLQTNDYRDKHDFQCLIRYIEAV